MKCKLYRYKALKCFRKYDIIQTSDMLYSIVGKEYL